MRYEVQRDWSINDTSTLLDNPNYKRFYDKKKEIQSKYDERLFQHPLRTRETKKWFTEKGRDIWLKYLKEITNLMWENDGDFQKFLWDITSEHDKLQMSRRARGKRYGKY